MICLRCGHCCSFPVVIVIDPKIGPAENNLYANDGRERCQHLVGDAPPFSCAIHDYPWFEETPCGRHIQTEYHDDEYCRLGNFRLNGKTLPERAS